MKKTLLIATPFLVLVSLSACSSNNTSSDSTAASKLTLNSEASNAKVAAPVEISITVGTDSAKDRVEEVALGSQVNITLTNPTADDEFHLHGYDLSAGKTPKGEAAVITFTADKAGEFEIESHVTEEVLAVISVK